MSKTARDLVMVWIRDLGTRSVIGSWWDLRRRLVWFDAWMSPVTWGEERAGRLGRGAGLVRKAWEGDEGARER